MIEPGQGIGIRDSERDPAFPESGEQFPDDGLRPPASGIPEDEQAADDDFLEQAIGRPLEPDEPQVRTPVPAPN